MQIKTFFYLALIVPLTWSCSQHHNPTELTRVDNDQLPPLETVAELPSTPPSQFITNPQLAPPVESVTVEELTPPEPEQTLSEEVKDLTALGEWEEGESQQLTEKEVKYDFPVTINRQVEYYLDVFQNKQRKSFGRWLARSGRYLPMIKNLLAEAGLPLDLVYLPMIESGYSLTAYSKARAVGPWQFIRATGRHYGLEINDYIDERRDPVRSTQAAILYLSELYDQFGSWPLAVAGYNAGEGKIMRGIRRYKTDNFWELAKHRFLKLETRRYVPKLIAAIIIAKSPDKYGFTDIQYESPLAFDTANVPRWTSLQAVATAISTDLDTIRNLNRHLRKAFTPPQHESFALRVPAGKGEQLEMNLPMVHVSMSIKYKTHIIRQGETLSRICRKYNLNKTTLLKANNLRKAKLSPGKRLRIPHQVANYRLLTEKEFANRNKYAAATDEFVLHKIRPGETLSQIAERYQVSPQMIAAWNGLPSVNRIRAGQQLALYVSEELNETFHLRKKTTRTVSRAKSKSSSHPSYYRVRGGDSLWTIARRFKLSTDVIKRLNNLKSNLIHPGTKLRIEI